MSDSTRITGPVSIQSDSRQRVAFDLMERIAQWEGNKDQEKRSRDYWIKLYATCDSIVQGAAVDGVLKMPR